MPNLSNILRGVLGGEYNMGRDLDEEERRQIEELRAQGIYVPQERQSSPFRYGAGTVRKRNLADMRTAMQPEQERRMKELMAARGEQERQRMARERQNTVIKIATENQARLTELDRRRGSAFDPQSGQSYKDYLRDRIGKPTLSPAEQAELTVRQQRQLPIRKEEAAVATAEQGVATGALKQPTIVAQEKDKQETLELAAKVRGLLSPEFAKHMAQGTNLDRLLQNKLLEAKLSVENSAAGRAIHQQAANNKEAQLMIDAATIDRFNVWLQGGSEDAQRFLDAGGQRGLDIANQFNTMQARLLQASRSGGLGGLGGTLPPDFYGGSPRRPAGGRGTAAAEYSSDEDLRGRPLSPPITNRTQAPVQPTQVPRAGGQRPMRPMRQTQPLTQPQAQVAPVSSPAQRRPPPAWATRRAGGSAADKAKFAQKDELIREIRIITSRLNDPERTRYQRDIDRVAAATAELEALLAEYTWLQE